MTEKFAGLKVGDTVVITGYGGGLRHSRHEAKVGFVGRKWFNVEGESSTRFSLATGQNSGKYLYPQAITLAEEREKVERVALESFVLGQGIRPQGIRFEMETLRKLAVALGGEERTEYRLFKETDQCERCHGLLDRNGVDEGWVHLDDKREDHVPVHEIHSQFYARGSREYCESELAQQAQYVFPEYRDRIHWYIDHVTIIEKKDSREEVHPTYEQASDRG